MYRKSVLIAIELTTGAAELLETNVCVTREDIHIHYCFGSGYAIPDPEDCAAIRHLARAEGILTDPVYNRQGPSGVFQLLAQRLTETTIFFLSTLAMRACCSLWK